MKTFRFIAVLPAAVFLLSGCTIGSGGVKVEPFAGFTSDSTAPPAAYRDGWEAVRRFDFDAAIFLICLTANLARPNPRATIRSCRAAPQSGLTSVSFCRTIGP